MTVDKLLKIMIALDKTGIQINKIRFLCWKLCKMQQLKKQDWK